ncbi:PAS domain-containing protein [Nakamurella sp. A5-74]|uniref:PAS domain-containing protein n=1 Tax=Nakamurella sp. A5-74 TaxID=3158264 RepID=A0AAU8DV88_9ACTN
MTELAGWSTIPPDALPLVLMRAVAAAQSITIADAGSPDAPLVYTNKAFLELTGYDSSAVLGRNCRFLQGPDTDPAAVAELSEAVHAGREVCTVLLNYRRDGTPFWNEVTVTPVQDADGRISHLIGYQVDVTERVEHDAHVWKAVDARHLIGQAQGIIMRAHGVDSSTSFDVLRRLSQQSNTKLSAVAAEIVSTHKLPTSADPTWPGDSTGLL